MSKGPLVTRTELRKRSREEKKRNVVSKKSRSWRKKRISEKKKKFRRFIVKKRKTKTDQQVTSRRILEASRTGTWLNKAIIIVAILLAVVAYIVLNL